MARILIVDDEEMDRLLGRTVLEAAGHEILYAANGEIALRVYESQEIDVVITDLAMPNVDGLLLIEQILAVDKRAPIIVVSGVKPGHLERAADLGAAATIQKPYEPEDLLDAVNSALSSAPPGDLPG